LIDEFSGIHPGTSFVQEHRSLIALIIITGVTFFAVSVAQIAGRLFSERIAQSVTKYIFGLLHQKHASLDLVYLEDANQMDQIHRADQEAAYRPVKLIQEGLALVQAIIACLVIGGLLLTVHWFIGVFLFLAIMPGFWVRIRFVTDLYRFRQQNSRKERENYYYNRILTGFAFAKEIRHFGLGDYFKSRFEQIQDHLNDQKNALVRRRAIAEIGAQAFALYNISAAENIAMGNVARPLDQDELKRAAKNAGIHDVLENLPLGYNNPLGNLFEKGEQLSMGQWQKMAVARAFYRNAPILFMDEPTSALDAETELNLLQNLRSLARNKTVLIISHRFSTINWVDIIYVMEEGKIIESGSHEQLMSQRRRYFEMFESSRMI
jgi:ABC-type multidrug transport system fused ATPase/permease subunit